MSLKYKETTKIKQTLKYSYFQKIKYRRHICSFIHGNKSVLSHDKKPHE